MRIDVWATIICFAIFGILIIQAGEWFVGVLALGLSVLVFIGRDDL